MSDRWLRYLRFWGPNVDADIDDELQYHLEQRTESLLGQGLSRDAARTAALDAFGDVDDVRHALRAHDRRKLRRERRADMLQDLTHDLRYALRQLRAAPRFATAVVLVLALGIGANTAIFSAIDAAFFRPLPFPHAERLMSLVDGELPFEPAMGRPQTEVQLSDIAADSGVFAHVAAYASGGLNLTGGADPSRVAIAYVTSDFFPTLGRFPAVGRSPVVDEFTKNGAKAVVISDGLWRREFGGETATIGRAVALNGRSYRVVGIMPPDFRFPAGTDVWIPLQLPFGFDVIEAFRNFLPAKTVARLAPGVTVPQAIQHATALRRRFRSIRTSETPATDLVRPLQQTLVGDRRTALLVLAASALLLLLVACANVTNLLLARGAARQREIAVRVVLGATRVRIIRQLTVESLLLAVAGSIVAIAVALFAVHALSAILPPSLVGVAPPAVDGRVLLFTLAMALATSLVFGIWPALAASRTDLGDAMKSAGAGGGGTRRRGAGARGLLVVAEVSIAVMLLVGAGLMIESLSTLLGTDSGMRATHVVTGRLMLPNAKFHDPAAKARFLVDVVARLRASSDVAAAAAVSALPMEAAGGIGLAIAPDDAYDEAHRAVGMYLMATPGYFATMGVPLRGEDLPATTDASRKVVVLNDTLAKTLWPSGDAIGRKIRFGADVRTVIGVVGNIRTDRLDNAAAGQMYLPMAEEAQPYASVVVRSLAPAAAMTARLRDAVRAVDPMQPVYSV